MTPEKAIEILNGYITNLTKFSELGEENEAIQVHRTAIEALERQIPKKTMKIKGDWTDDPRCSRCNRLIKGGYRRIYCPSCGQQYEEEVKEEI